MNFWVADVGCAIGCPWSGELCTGAGGLMSNVFLGNTGGAGSITQTNKNVGYIHIV